MRSFVGCRPRLRKVKERARHAAAVRWQKYRDKSKTPATDLTEAAAVMLEPAEGATSAPTAAFSEESGSFACCC